jgi:hypothetical protein
MAIPLGASPFDIRFWMGAHANVGSPRGLICAVKQNDLGHGGRMGNSSEMKQFYEIFYRYLERSSLQFGLLY